MQMIIIGLQALKGQKSTRFDLNGEIDTIIPVPVEKPTKIVFGGNNLQSIYVTSIGKDFDNNIKFKWFHIRNFY